MRISGIVSGFDTDEMVKSMMAMERFKVDRFEKSKQTNLWRQDSYNNMNKAFANFILSTQKDMGLKKTSSTGLITSSNYKNVDYVKKATSSNESAATVSSSSKAVNGTYKVDVKQLAEGAGFTSADMRGKILEEPLTFEINSGMKNEDGSPIIKKILVEKSPGATSITMNDVAKAINNSKVKMLNGTIITDDEIGGLSSDDKKKVKEVSIGISAFYDEKNGRLFMQTKETGSNVKIDITGNDSFTDMLGFTGTRKTEATFKDAKQAEIIFNDVTLRYDSNNINLNGLNIELKSVAETTINVSTNTEGIMEKVQKLVNDYNELVDLAAKNLTEKPYPGYQPLTSEERKAMSETDVKLWDEKAKSGLLNRDETIEKTLQSIRNDLYKTVEGLDPEFNHITKIGISTEKYSRGSSGGKLEIDTEKLKKAIEANPDAVMDLLFTDGKDVPDAPEGSIKPANGTTKKGIFTGIYDNIITGMKAIVDKSGPGQDADLLRGVNPSMLIDFVTKKSSISDIDKAVQDMNRQIDNLNVLLAKKEDSYYAKFTAMEKAMHKMNGQSGWLQQQFG